MVNVYPTFENLIRACENTINEILLRFYSENTSYFTIKGFKEEYGIGSISDFQIVSFYISNEYIYLDVIY